MTVQWTKSLADYPPSDWTLKYHFIGASNVVVTATTSGGDFLVSLTVATTEIITPGSYRLVGYVQDDASSPTERHQIYQGDVEVVLNPAFQADGQQGGETRSFWRKVRDNLKSIIEGKSAQSMSNYQIAGRNVNKMSWAEILDAYDRASTMVRQEEAEEARARGEQTGALVRIQFQRP
jgi:hypothetical protein